MQHDRDLGGLDRGLGAQGGVVLHAAGGVDPPAQARGVDEPPDLAVQLDQRVDRVDGRAGDRRATTERGLPRQPVEQAGLADVRLADQRDPARAAAAPRRTCRAGVSGSASRIASSRSPEPRPCSPLTGYGSPRPSDHSAAASAASRSSSTLVAASSTGRSRAAQHPGHGLVGGGGADRSRRRRAARRRRSASPARPARPPRPAARWRRAPSRRCRRR